jgi:hypothetical protein
VSVVIDPNEKAKSTVQWVPFHSHIRAEVPAACPQFIVPPLKFLPPSFPQVRLYDHLFLSEDPPDDDWEKALNPHSEVSFLSYAI